MYKTIVYYVMIDYEERKYKDLSREDKTCLRKLARSRHSGFKALLSGKTGNPNTCKVVLAIDTETRCFIGWCSADKLKRIAGGVRVGVFVSPEYRRQGIGTELMQRALDFADASRARCTMDNEESTGFYRTFGAIRRRDHLAEFKRGLS